MNTHITFTADRGRQLRWKSYGTFLASGVLGAVINTTALVAAARFRHRRKRLGATTGPGIDRPGHGGTSGQHVPERPLGVRGQAGDLQARVVACVGGEDRAAAGIGNHGDPASGGHRLGCQQRRGVE